MYFCLYRPQPSREILQVNVLLSPQLRSLLLPGFIIGLLCLMIGLGSCSKQDQVKIGFVGGLSGRAADLGLSGRNGVILAVEEQNRKGGLNGKDVELLIMDDKQNADAARKAVTALLKQNVDVIIGPMTSSMAQAIVPLVNKQRVVMISPSTTTEELTGIDDYFFRVVASTSHYAKHHAFHLHDALDIKNISVIYDLNNKSFVESYFQDFSSMFEKLGGQINQVETFSSGSTASFFDLAQKAIGPDTEGILLIANAIDTAVLCQQIRKIDPAIRIALSEWSATEKLIELGGEAVEGVLFHQFFNRNSTAPTYRAFRKSYLERFSEEPGFAAVVGYDSAKVALTALAQRNNRTLKETIISISKFSGSQGTIEIDRFGDSSRKTHLSTIKDGQFFILNSSPDKN